MNNKFTTIIYTIFTKTVRDEMFWEWGQDEDYLLSGNFKLSMVYISAEYPHVFTIHLRHMKEVFRASSIQYNLEDLPSPSSQEGQLFETYQYARQQANVKQCNESEYKQNQMYDRLLAELG